MIAAIRKFLITGLLVWVPLGVTVLVVNLLIDLLDKTLILLPPSWRPEALIGIPVPGLGIIMSTIVVLLTGFLVTNFAGNRLLKLGERLVARIPLVRSIYSSVKQVTETVLNTEKNPFNKVVLIEYPRRGIWTLAFQTNEANAHINETANNKLVTVFVPTTPNPTSGFIMMLPEDEVKVLHMDIEDALKLVMSLGVITPPVKPRGDIQDKKHSINQ